MAEEGLSTNSDRILDLKLSNDLIKLQTNFNNFVIEEKEKTANLEKKNSFLENELKEVNKKIGKIIFDHKNEIEEMKQDLKQKDDKISFLEEEIKKKIQTINCENENKIEEMKQNIKQLKTENDQKDKKINSLEGKIKKIKSDNENEIKTLKQNFNKLIEENTKELKAVNDVCLRQKDDKINSLEDKIKKRIQDNVQLIEQIVQLLKNGNDQKDIKIISLEEEINKANDFFEKTIGDLIKINNLNCVKYVEIKNKWCEFHSGWICCFNNCINTNKPVGKCIKGNGFGNLINDDNINYIKCLEGKGGCDKEVFVYSENSFDKPQNCFTYSLYYFEIKCKSEGELNRDEACVNIGLKNCNVNNRIRFVANESMIKNEKRKEFRLPTTFNNNDIFGCGIVYPSSNKLDEEFPYIFFTQNGQQIGNGILLKGISDSFKPYVYLKCCSIEANFGNDLASKPFKYDISNHFILKEFINFI